MPTEPAFSSPSDAGQPPTWGLLLAAVRGEQRDYTIGPVGPAIVALAVPMVLEMLMESVFAVADVFFVGKLGAGAVATVGLTEALMTLVYTLAMGLSIGASAMVARRIGERELDAAAGTSFQAFFLAALVSVGIGILGVAFAPRFLAMMGASPEVLAQGSGYARVLLGGNLVVVMLFLANAICRGAGDPAIAMRSLWLANAFNLVLAPAFIFGWGPLPTLGVMGAAVGTTIGRGIGAIYTLQSLWRGTGRLQLHYRHFVPDLALMGRIVRLSAAGTFQMFIGMASWIGLVRVISTFGSEAVAGYTIGMRIVIFALLPSFGMANAAATMVGQCLGAGQPERGERAVWLAGYYNMWFLGAVGLVFVLFPAAIVSLFTTDPHVFALGSAGLRIVACGFLFYAYGMVLTQAFNGAGDTWTPTLINLGVFWCLEIPLAWILAHDAGMGPRGVFFAVTIAFSSLAVVSAWLFRKGRWKTRVV